MERVVAPWINSQNWMKVEITRSNVVELYKNTAKQLATQLAKRFASFEGLASIRGYSLEPLLYAPNPTPLKLQ